MIFASVVGAGAALLLGFAYAWAVAWIPFIYVNFLLTIGLGGAVGFLVGQAAVAGKLRNTFVVVVLSLVFATGAWYIAWAADPRARIFSEAPLLLWQPDALWAYVQLCYENGTWGLGRGGGTVSGIPLGIVWVIEAGTIIGCALFLSLGAMMVPTFCERCGVWIESQQGVQRLALRDGHEGALTRLLTGDLSAAAELPRSDAYEPHLRLDLTCCPTCRESSYLTIERVTYQTDDKGNASEKTETVVDRLAIEPRDIETVRTAGYEAEEDATEIAKPS
jgi:hypothetical protein